MNCMQQQKRTIERFLRSAVSISLFLLTPSGNTITIYSTAETILGRHSTLEVRSIHLGGLFHAEEEIQMTSTMANFVGQMQGFVYNGQRYDAVPTYRMLKLAFHF